MDLRIPNEDHSLSPVVLEYIDHWWYMMI